MRYILCCAFVIWAKWCFTQNLVVNGSFEEHSKLPDKFSQFDVCEGWFEAASTPDYYHTKGFGSVKLPQGRSAKVHAFDGNAVGGFYALG